MNQPHLPNETAELVRQEVAFRGYFKVVRYFFRHGLHQGGQSKVIAREVFERGQAAAVLPYDAGRDEVALIRQFRAGAYVAGHHPFTWEIVAGIIEDGETAETLVRREAVEEAGLEVADLLPVQNVMLTPGACSESCQIFVGRADTGSAGGIFGLESEGENILVKVMSFAEAYAMIERCEVDNAVSVIALQWLALHRDDMRRRWR
ncbi:NUDIX domain-containing protein [Reyranella sp.]|jgi:ADP-ribose pyrophosphatase|uniref:NUDIX domain-containing protein n=1 Tax=Reyranella sp. TaxID=1929291 RepID=UPI002F91C926